MKAKIKFTLLVIGTLLFNILFWQESIGLNALIFTIFILAALFYTFPDAKKSRYALIMAVGTLISSCTVVYHASILSVVVWIFSIIMIQPFFHYNKLRTLFYGYLSAVSTLFTSFSLIPESIKLKKRSSNRLKKFFKFLKLTLIPLIVLYIFYWIFKLANPIFDDLSNRVIITISDWMIELFKNISFIQIIFTIWGFIMIAWLLYKRKKDIIAYDENKYVNEIKRLRKKKIGNSQYFGKKGLKQKLKNEFRIGLIMIVLVNILLLTINIIDIITIWFGFEYTPHFDLRQFVHEGTYLLILSILLSIGIMVYFFRKNINFYPHKKQLQTVSYVWIIQNTILLISVIIRNLHYIEYFGLAYKRIGVFFFLALVVFGLITLYIKIKDIKSTFYLIRLNSWAVYIGFVLFAVPDWDVIIARHNLDHPLKNNIETSYLLTFDDKALPLIDQRRDILKQSKQYNTYQFFYDSYEEVYNNRVKHFMNTYKDKSILSWNYADDKAYKYFENKLKETEGKSEAGSRISKSIINKADTVELIE